MGALPGRGDSSLWIVVATKAGDEANDIEGEETSLGDASGLSQLVTFVSWLT